jgi:hypothetical protein
MATDTTPVRRRRTAEQFDGRELGRADTVGGNIRETLG